MPEQEEVAPEAVEKPPESAESFEEASESALGEVEIEEESGEEVKPESAPAGKDASKAEADLDHIAWAKSVQGNTDEKGEIIADRVLKQAHELHKQNQKQQQSLSELEKSLSHPLIAQAFREVYMGGDKATEEKPPEKPPEEKTDEEVLGEFVDKRTEPQLTKMQGVIDFLYGKALTSEYQRVQGLLEGEFENYADIRDEVGKTIAGIAQKTNTTAADLLARLAMDGSLHKTLQSAAVNLLYPGLKEEKQKRTEANKKEEEGKQKRARLGSRKSGSSQVEKVPTKAESWNEAIEQAEEELAAVS